MGRRRVRRPLAGPSRCARFRQAYDHCGEDGLGESRAAGHRRRPRSITIHRRAARARSERGAGQRDLALACRASDSYRYRRRNSGEALVRRKAGYGARRSHGRRRDVGWTLRSARSTSIRTRRRTWSCASAVKNANRAIVVAPVTNYLPAADVIVDGKRISIRHNGHAVSGTLGDATMRIDGGSGYLRYAAGDDRREAVLAARRLRSDRSRPAAPALT